MRESAGKRLAIATLFALLAGVAVALWNPMDHVKADLRADTQGLSISLEIAAHAIEKACARVA